MGIMRQEHFEFSSRILSPSIAAANGTQPRRCSSWKCPAHNTGLQSDAHANEFLINIIRTNPPGFPSGVFILFSSSKIPNHQNIVMKTFKENNPSSVGKRYCKGSWHIIRRQASQNICPQGSTAKASPWFKSLGCSPLCFVLKLKF